MDSEDSVRFVRDEDTALEILIDSFKFPFTGIGSLLIGGFVELLTIIYVGSFLHMGYCVRVSRTIIERGETMPGWLDDPGRLVGDIVGAFAIRLIYGICIAIVAVVFIVPLIMLSHSIDNALWTLLFVACMAIIMIVVIPLAMLMDISTMTFAETSEFGEAINLARVVRLLRENVLQFILAYVVQFVAGLALIIPIALLYIVVIMGSKDCACLFILVVMWYIFYMDMVRTNIFARFYRRIIEAGAEDDSVPTA